MSEKKQLGLEELEKVSGGTGSSTLPSHGTRVPANHAKYFVGRNFYVVRNINGNDHDTMWALCRLDKADEEPFNNCGHYYMYFTVISVSPYQPRIVFYQKYVEPGDSFKAPSNYITIYLEN